MIKNIYILMTFFLLTFSLQGQNKQDIYEIKIGNYSTKTSDRDYLELKKTFTVNIQMPQYIRHLISYDMNGNEHPSSDTTNGFVLSQLMDSIPLKSVPKFIDTEVELFCNGDKIKVAEISIEAFQADGIFINREIFSNKISASKDMADFIKKCLPNSYIILDIVYSSKMNGEKIVLPDRIGWKIIK